MGEETEYHSWYLPDDGETDWGDEYRAMVDDLDKKTVDVGTREERPSSPPEGVFYYDLTTDGFYQYLNGEWVPRGSWWQNYELLFNDQTPDSEQYIRFETE